MKRKLFTVLVVVCLCVVTCNAQTEISNQLSTYTPEIKKVVNWAIGVVFLVGIIHVVSAKSDEDKGKMKRLMMAYGAAFVFVLVAKALADTLLK